MKKTDVTGDESTSSKRWASAWNKGKRRVHHAGLATGVRRAVGGTVRHPERTLAVFNVDARVTEAHVLQLFSPFGNVEYIEIQRQVAREQQQADHNGGATARALVEFAAREEAVQALCEMDGKMLLDRMMTVRFVPNEDEEEDGDGEDGGEAPTGHDNGRATPASQQQPTGILASVPDDVAYALQEIRQIRHALSTQES